ncbi:MAG TPA: hypothetical protein VMT66_17920 [Steroidobacteraceae bacterium]|nr:hypothetical protein [Steroidobacteraceae bacterium]
MSDTLRRTAPLLIFCLVPTLMLGEEVPPGKPCALLTQSEIEGALAMKLPPLAPAGPFCVARTSERTVTVRMAPSSGTPGRESKGIEKAKQMGFQVEVKTDGPITCSRLMPPASMASVGFNTTCSVSTAGSIAAIEVSATTRENMATMEQLKPLAELIAKRL